jgi:hypothetical protein
MQKVLLESALAGVVGEVKASREWKKRERLMGLAYDLGGRETSDKKVVLNRLKELLGSNSNLYIEWLSVLVREETASKDNRLL